MTAAAWRDVCVKIIALPIWIWIKFYPYPCRRDARRLCQNCSAINVHMDKIVLLKEALPIDEFRMVLGGQPTPFCFYPVSRVTRNFETRRHQQLQI